MSRRRILLLFFGVWLLYLAVGVYLAADARVYFGDSLSRVQAAQSVLFSRDPHLSAIGFIFTPLTAIVQLPMTVFTPWFPAITTSALSAAVMSSGFMAGSVVQLTGIARDRGLSPVISIAVTVCYAANPMIILYAANGMSEAPYLFFLAWAVRRGMRWADTDDVHDLVTTGMALGFAYLTRYDGAAAALGAGLLVAVTTYRRADRTDRIPRVLLDVLLVALPSAAAFLIWAFTSWLITGNLFAQFSSEYGNAAIIEQSGGSGSTTAVDALQFSIIETAILTPLFPILFATVVIFRRRQHRLYPLLAPVPLIGGVLLFQFISYARGSTFGFLRFYITVILLTAIVALLAVPARRDPPARRLGTHADLPTIPPERRRTVTALTALAIVAVLVAIPVTAVGMRSPKYAPQEFAFNSLVRPDPDAVDQRTLDAKKVLRSFSTERAIAQYLDRMNLPDGSVLTDTVYGFAVVAQSARPKQFVIPSDQDFTEILNDPAAHGVRFLLSVPNEGRGTSDALNIRFPTLYETGAGVGALIMEAPNQGTDLPDWRIYRVSPSADLIDVDTGTGDDTN
ncbi:glycosyltransferase family 39 protein [Gordonia sp. CPCC 205515]|uniref:ABC transporter n=1 Tax=Gordonia sp. CPCC 205515 TaxID=3140791 RepID=UPI003AF3A42B